MSTAVATKAPSNRIWKIVLILLIILILLGAGFVFVQEKMRTGLLKGWKEAAEEHGIKQFPEKTVKTELNKLGVIDLNTLIRFSKQLKAGQYADAFLMWKDVKPILQDKTNLGNISELSGIAFGT